MRWDTGTGKTLAAEGAILLKRAEGYDLSLYVVRPNHIEGARRKLLAHTGLEAIVFDGTPRARERRLVEADDAVADGSQPVLLFNPEKFSTDTEYLSELVEGRRVLVVFDEAQKRYGNRSTQLYRNTAKVLYTSSTGDGIHYPREGYERPSQLFGVAMSATPLTRSPENVFNQIRLIFPGLLGSINDFNNLYVAYRDHWGNVVRWKNLDHLAAAIAPILHQASKEDPEIAAQFPKQMPPEVAYCDMDRQTARLYAVLQREYADIGYSSLLDYSEILAAIGCLQMIVSNPRAVWESARLRAEYEDERADLIAWLDQNAASAGIKPDVALRDFEKKNKRGSEVALKLVEAVDDDSLFTDTDKSGNLSNGKLINLQEYLEAHDGKAVVFCSEVVMQGIVSGWLTEWGVKHVIYNGTLSRKQATEAIDSFREDDSVRVFLSTDAGQDSIDLPEANLTAHYDLPQDWSWASLTQRDNRQHRIDSDQESVRRVYLTVPGTVEDRKFEVVERKHGFHQAVFEGAEQADEGPPVQEDALYVLTGHRAD
jgi:hypothetical protein